MVAPRHRSRSLKKRVRRLPGGGSGTRYVKKMHGKHACASCGAVLRGVPSGLKPSSVRKLAKSRKKPARPMGGGLCGRCLRERVKAAVRKTEEEKE